MMNNAVSHRNEIFSDLKDNPEVDVLIIGAGVNGIGTFRDLALQGVNVLIVDKQDFCSGASAASSHMVHGGIRYLENGEFRLVKEAVQERNRLLENAPHLVDPLATTIPIFNWTSGILNAPLKFLNLLNKPSERGAIVIKLGLMMYDAYTRSQGTVPNHTFQMKAASLAQFPKLNPDILCTATYYDAMMPSPERICMDLLADAQQASDKARALNYTRVGKAQGDAIEIVDVLENGRLTLKPKVVINAAGPWIDLANEDIGLKTEFMGGTKGSHLVLDHPELLSAIGGREFFFENKDGRIVLIYPLKNRVMIGTSDLRIDDPSDAVCTEAEIEYFLEMVGRVFPAINVARSHIVFTFSGVRPLPASKANATGQISRDHSIETIAPTPKTGFPILNLIGGKWTTFRAFAEKTTDETLALLQKSRRKSTSKLAIGGGKNFPTDKDEEWRWLQICARENDLSVERVTQLFERYGTKTKQMAAYIKEDHDYPLANQPAYSQREIEYLAQHEQVIHLDDLILRRTLIGMLGETTAPLLTELAEIVGNVLGWASAQKETEIERTKRILLNRHLVEI